MQADLIRKKIFRQKVNSQQGYEDWIILPQSPIFDQYGNCYLGMQNIDYLSGVQYFSLKEITEMEEVGIHNGTSYRYNSGEKI